MTYSFSPVCMHECTDVGMYVYMHACALACMHACMRACVYVSMYMHENVYVYVCGPVYACMSMYV